MVNITLEKFLKILEWIFFIGLCLVSIFYSSTVLMQFYSVDSSLKQNEEPITELPTLVICIFTKNETEFKWKYGTDYEIEYDFNHFTLNTSQTQQYENNHT